MGIQSTVDITRDKVFCNYGNPHSGIRWPCKVIRTNENGTVTITGSGLSGDRLTETVPRSHLEIDNHQMHLTAKISCK